MILFWLLWIFGAIASFTTMFALFSIALASGLIAEPVQEKYIVAKAMIIGVMWLFAWPCLFIWLPLTLVREISDWKDSRTA